MRMSLFLSVWAILAASASADLRPPVYDSELAESELIVVGRIEPGTFTPATGGPRVHAKLIVAETLKGTPPGEIFDFRIEGPTLVVGGGAQRRAAGVNVPAGAAPGKIALTLTDGRLFSPHADCPDLSQDALFFLRKGPPPNGKDRDGRDGVDVPYHITRFEDVQPMALKPFFAALVSPRRDEGLRALLAAKTDAKIKTRVLEFMAERHSPAYLPVIAAALDDADEDVQAAAASAAANVGDASAVPLFRKLLAHTNPRVRAAACVFLCRFRDVESIPAIGEAIRGAEPAGRAWVAGSLRQMESLQAVPVLLDLLDERTGQASDPAARANYQGAYWQACQAAASLAWLTGIHFPLDADEARQLWEKHKGLSEEVLLRKSILADIENLTHAEEGIRYAAYHRLKEIANRQFGSTAWMSVMFDGRRERRDLQEQWRSWAKADILKSRLEWVLDGFGKGGVNLAAQPGAKDVDVLMDVLAFCRNMPTRGHWGPPPGPRKNEWLYGGFEYNTIWLLEALTGRKVGMVDGGGELSRSWRLRNVLEERWLSWWADNRNRARVNAWPVDKPVTEPMLAAARDLPSRDVPLQLTIRPTTGVFTNAERAVMHVEVRNISRRPITLARRPREIRYGSTTGSGSSGHTTQAGTDKQDYVELKPGQSLEWEDDNATFGGYTQPRSITGFRQTFVYPLAGSPFGLRAWRGAITSNAVAYELVN